MEKGLEGKARKMKTDSSESGLAGSRGWKAIEWSSRRIGSSRAERSEFTRRFVEETLRAFVKFARREAGQVGPLEAIENGTFS